GAVHVRLYRRRDGPSGGPERGRRIPSEAVRAGHARAEGERSAGRLTPWFGPWRPLRLPARGSLLPVWNRPDAPQQVLFRPRLVEQRNRRVETRSPVRVRVAAGEQERCGVALATRGVVQRAAPQSRHDEIREHEPHARRLAQRLECLEAVRRGDYLIPGRFENALDGAAQLVVVLHDQDRLEATANLGDAREGADRSGHPVGRGEINPESRSLPRLAVHID